MEETRRSEAMEGSPKLKKQCGDSEGLSTLEEKEVVTKR